MFFPQNFIGSVRERASLGLAKLQSSAVYYNFKNLTGADAAAISNGNAGLEDLGPNNLDATVVNSPTVRKLQNIPSLRDSGTMAVSTGSNLNSILGSSTGFDLFMLYQTEDGRPTNATFLCGGISPTNRGFYVAIDDTREGKLVAQYGNPTDGYIQKVIDYIFFGDGFNGAKLIRIKVRPTSFDFYIDEQLAGSSYLTSGTQLTDISLLTLTNYSGPNNFYVNTINNNGSAHSNNILGSMFDFAIMPAITEEEAHDISAYLLTWYINIGMGQSNDEGQAEAARMAISILGSTAYARTKFGCYVYPKTTRTNADDGSWADLNAGTNTKGPDILASGFDTVGDETPMLHLLRDKTKQPVFWIKTSRGGSRLQTDGSNPDWAVSSNELYLQATQYWWTVAKNKLLTVFPSLRLKVVIHWHQGESDANDATARANYLTNIRTFFTAFRAYDPLFARAPLFVTKLYFALDADEDEINDALMQFVSESDNTYLIDISDQPRKIDLTVGQQGGLSPTTTGGDDDHNSYLGQIAKGERKYTKLVEIKYF